WGERPRRGRRRARPWGRSGWRGGGVTAATRGLGVARGGKARVVGKPEGYRDLAFGTGLRRQALMHHALEPCLFHPLRYGVGRETEPAMGILFAEEFKVMGREVDDQEPALRPQHARGLADRAAAVVEKVQHLMDDHDIKGVARYREIEDIALTDAAIADACMVEPAAREGQHFTAEIDPETALDL